MASPIENLLHEFDENIATGFGWFNLLLKANDAIGKYNVFDLLRLSVVLITIMNRFLTARSSLQTVT